MSTNELLRQQSLMNVKVEEKVYQVTRLPRDVQDREEIICFTSKASAQRLIAGLAEMQSEERYRVSYFTHPLLPGLGREQ